MEQVKFNKESTERQYALKDKALQLGWSPSSIKILDADLGISGAYSNNREDFKTVVADVSMGKIGAVFALEASRLSRSSTDWHRLLELCSLTNTLIIDEDGCYDPSDFNDQLLLGLKGTMSAAELHFIRARLQGGKINKAKKGELRFSLPIGYSYTAEGKMVLDPDLEIQHVVQLVFDAFKLRGTAFGVVQYFIENKIKFPKKSYGGVWDGKLIWSEISYGRVIKLLKNPIYSGTYVYGRHKYQKQLSEQGAVQIKEISLPLSSWGIVLENHHDGYITWEQYLENQITLEKNRTNVEATMTSGITREGAALLQGLLVCGTCGCRLTPCYAGNNGFYPQYRCTRKTRDTVYRKDCIATRIDRIDEAISQRVLEIITPENLEVATKALDELEQREQAINKKWTLSLNRAEYEVQLAQRAYDAVDPANRLVASTLEKRWNDALTNLEEVRTRYAEYQRKEALVTTAEQKAQILSLGKDLPRLWLSKTTKMKDRKRILRLLIKDITVDKFSDDKSLVLHVRWQGGLQEDILTERPIKECDRSRCPPEIVDKVKLLALEYSDTQIAEMLNNENLKTGKGKNFTSHSIKCIRRKNSILGFSSKRPNEFYVKEVAKRFNVSQHVVFYWIEIKLLMTRQTHIGSRHLITITSEKEMELNQWIKKSNRINKIVMSPKAN